MERYASAVLALSLFEGAYISEIIRSGILGVPKGQWEAALSSGMNTWETYRFVILPQAVRNILPPLTGQAVSLIKDSALVSTIAIYDLTMQGQAIVSETFLVFEIWFTVAAIYLVFTIAFRCGERDGKATEEGRIAGMTGNVHSDRGQVFLDEAWRL